MQGIIRILCVCVLTVAAAGSALAQRGRNVYPDEAAGAREALGRVEELRAAGNIAESLRVLQRTMDGEAEQLLPTAADPDLFVPVRQMVNELLLANRELLERYRAEESARAARLLEQGKLDELERTRLLTGPGLEAVLRLAQLEYEAARFESARLMLAQLERHPDRVGKAAADAAGLALRIAAQIERPQVRAWASGWAREAGVAETVPPMTLPGLAVVNSRNGMEAGPAPDWEGVTSEPLQSVVVDAERFGSGTTRPARPSWVPRLGSFWIMGSVADDLLFVSDGESVRALDSATLSEAWSVTPPGAQTGGVREDAQLNAWTGQSDVREDAALVAVGQGVAVVATGTMNTSTRRADRRLHALDARTGRLIWSADPQWLDERLRGASVRGAPAIDGDTVVVALRKPSMRRLTTVYIAGLDLHEGTLKWVRTLGSVGTQPFQRPASRGDATLVREGVVYRGDDMGVLGAFEAATGRPLWVRTSEPAAMFDASARRMPMIGAQFTFAPVAFGENVYFIEPTRGRVVGVSAVDGTLKASRSAEDLGEPKYLLAAGDTLAAVGLGRVAFIKPENLASGAPSLSTPATGEGFMGRAVVAGTSVVAPLAGSLSVIDPVSPRTPRTVNIEASGNVLIAGGASGAHVIITDAARTHTYMSWPRAEALLRERIERRPTDPRPLLTFIELADRTGRRAMIPELADRVLALAASPAGRAGEAGATPNMSGAEARERLYGLLLKGVRDSRRAWTRAGGTGGAGKTGGLNELAAIGERLARAAETPEQQTAMLFEQAWLAEVALAPRDAVERYQRVLLDRDLAGVVLDAGAAVRSATGEVLPLADNAGEEASVRLAALLRSVGYEAYAAFDDEAARVLASAGAAPEALAAVARQYPASSVAAEAWGRAGQAYQAAGRLEQARSCLGAGLESAELGFAMGRPDALELVGKLAGLFAMSSGQPSDVELLYHLARRLSRQYPTLALQGSDGMTPAALAQSLRPTVFARGAMPRLGTAIGHRVQVLEGWEPMLPLVATGTGVSNASVPMINSITQEVSLFAAAAENGQLRRVWTRRYDTPPSVVRVSPDATLLFWPTSAGGMVEAVSSADGVTLYRTPEFASLFAGAPGNPGDNVVGANAGNADEDRVATPLDGPVRGADLLVCVAPDADGAGGVVTLVQRRGRAAAFDIATGKTLWSGRLPMTRVFEAEVSRGVLILGGAAAQAGAGKAIDNLRPGNVNPANINPIVDATGIASGDAAAVVVVDARSGNVVSRLGPAELGDHPRWIRAMGDGDAIIGTSEALLRVSTANGQVKWKRLGRPGRMSIAGWAVGSGVFVLDSDVNLWRVALEDGAGGEQPLDTRGKITFPMTPTVLSDRLVISSTQGVLVYHESGALVGADALEAAGSIEPPVIGEGVVVAVESSQNEMGGDAEGSAARLFFFDTASARMLDVRRLRLHDSPRQVTLLDGKVLITESPVTIVFDAPAPRK